MQRLFCVLFFSVIYFLNAQNATDNDSTQDTSDIVSASYNIAYSIDWQTLTLTSKIHTLIPDDLNVNESLYFRQNTAYNTIEETLPSILSAIIDTLPFSSQNSLSQFMKQYNIYTTGLNNIYINTSLIHHRLDKNFFGITILYASKLSPFIVNLLFSQFSKISIPQEASLRGILRDIDTMYTHLVFSVEKPLLVQERESKKKLLHANLIPRVVAEDGRIVYTPEYFENILQNANTDNPNTSSKALPFQYIYEENTKDMSFITSALIIIPIALNNKTHPDIVISNKDGDMILGSVILRKIIRTGKVIFIISSENKNFTTLSIKKKE